MINAFDLTVDDLCILVAIFIRTSAPRAHVRPLSIYLNEMVNELYNAKINILGGSQSETRITGFNSSLMPRSRYAGINMYRVTPRNLSWENPDTGSETTQKPACALRTPFDPPVGPAFLYLKTLAYVSILFCDGMFRPTLYRG